MSWIGEEGLIKDRNELLLREGQTILTLAYILMIGIGMVFQYRKYAEFDINIFEHADVLDFFVAPFADRKVFVFALVSVVLPTLFIRADGWWRTKHPRSYSWAYLKMDKKPWFEKLRWLSLLLLYPLYIIISSHNYGKIERQSINNSQKYEIEFFDGGRTEGKYIGKTHDVIFMEVDDRTRIYPYSSTVRYFGPITDVRSTKPARKKQVEAEPAQEKATKARN